MTVKQVPHLEFDRKTSWITPFGKRSLDAFYSLAYRFVASIATPMTNSLQRLLCSLAEGRFRHVFIESSVWPVLITILPPLLQNSLSSVHYDHQAV